MKISDFRPTYLLVILKVTICSAILTGNGQISEDITSVPKYGCHWTGGNNPMVTCTCRDDAGVLIIKRGSIPVYDTWSIVINACKQVIFKPSSIEDLRNLRKLNLINIPSLTLEPESLNWFGSTATYQIDHEIDESYIPSLGIHIENCTIERISHHTFKGRINNIQIMESLVREMDSFAFTTLKDTQTIVLKDLVIETMKPQAFKYFTTKTLILDNITMENVPSKSFSNVKVREDFKIKNSKFDTLFSGAFIIDEPKWFEVSNSDIKTIDGEAFTVTVNGDVYFKNNRIGIMNTGTFIMITPSRSRVATTALYLNLESDRVSSLGPNSLNVNGLLLKFVDLKLNETCNCDRLMNRFGDFKESFSEIKCILNGDSFTSFSDFKSNYCNVFSSNTTLIVVICVIGALLFIVIIVLAFYYHKNYKEGRYGSDKNEPTKNMSLIVPDGRTYRETEVHVILERADLLTTDL